jgi:hypothetical protein
VAASTLGVLEVEHGERGDNPRFLVTTLTELTRSRLRSRVLSARAARELIKDLKNAF